MVVRSLVCVEGRLKLREAIIPKFLGLVDSPELRLSHPEIRPLFLELKGFGGWRSFSTETDDARWRDADLHEVLDELVERVIRKTTDEDFAVCLIVEDFGQKCTDEGFARS